MSPLAIIPPRFRSQSRDNSRTNVSIHSRSSSVDSINDADNILAEPKTSQKIQRWNGHTREATVWHSLRRDPELFFPNGNCLIYLYTQGASRRGPSFRMPYDFLLYSACRPLIEQALMTSLQSPLYHPGSNTPPSYDNLHDPSSSDHTYLSLYLDAPPNTSPEKTYTYHITTRNFFAWLVGAPLVGKDPVSALIDLKIRMDAWRDVGADNYAALQQYVSEQGYDDYDEVELRIARERKAAAEAEADAAGRPRPYRNLGDITVQPVPSMETEERETRRGRRSSFSESMRSTGSKLRRTFSKSRKDKADAELDNRANVARPVTSGPTAARSSSTSVSLPKKVASRPSSRGPAPPKTPTAPSPAVGSIRGRRRNDSHPSTPTEPAPSQKLSKRTSFAESIKRRMSWVAGPLRPLEEPEPMPSGPPKAFKGQMGPPPGMGPPPPPPNPLPYRLTLQTQQMPKPISALPKSAPVMSSPTVRSGPSQPAQPSSGRSSRAVQASPVRSSRAVQASPVRGSQHAPTQSIQSAQSTQPALPMDVQKNFSRPDIGRSIQGSAANSQVSFGNHGSYFDGEGRERCECCSKLVRRPNAGMNGAPGPSGSTTSVNHISQRQAQIDSARSRSGSISSLISAGAYAPQPNSAPVRATNGAGTYQWPLSDSGRPASNAPRSRASSTGRRSIRDAQSQSGTTAPPLQASSLAAHREITKSADNRPRTPHAVAKEIVIPQYGNGLGSPRPSMESPNLPNGKGKAREPVSPVSAMSSSNGTVGRYTTSTAAYGLPSHVGATANSNSGFSGLPELDFRRPSVTSISNETASFVSAKPPASIAPNHQSQQGYTHFRPGASAAGSLHGGDNRPTTAASFHDLVTGPQKFAPSISGMSQRGRRPSQASSRTSVDGLIRELELAGIATPNDGVGDGLANGGVGEMRNVGLRT